MKKTQIKPIVLTAIFAIAFSACKKDDNPVNTPIEENESELITTFQISFKDSAGTAPDYVAVFRDKDGEGGNAPTDFDPIKLQANTTYYAEILLLDESKTETDTISNEVLEEAEDHLFCFTPDGISTKVKRTDSDGTYEIGLKSTWQTGNTADGKMKIVLKHQPEIKDGSCGLGETDIELDFITEIK